MERACHYCGTVTERWCPVCINAYANLPDVDTMTPLERATEVWWWIGPLEIPFDMLQNRIEKLAGRSVWTHELARPWEIAVEILGGEPVGFDVVLSKAERYAPTIVVEA